MKKEQENIYSLSIKIKEVLNKNPEYKDIILVSTLLAKAIKINNLNTIDIYKTGKEYDSLEDAILEKISELDTDISEEEQDIIDKYNLLQFDKEDLKLEEKSKEKNEIKKEEKKEVKKKEIKEEIKEEKSKIQLVKRYTVNSLIQLNKCKVYVSADDEKEFTTLTGRFYIYNKNIVNGRIKISKLPKEKITGWVDLKDIKVVKR